MLDQGVWPHLYSHLGMLAGGIPLLLAQLQQLLQLQLQVPICFTQPRQLLEVSHLCDPATRSRLSLSTLPDMLCSTGHALATMARQTRGHPDELEQKIQRLIEARSIEARSCIDWPTKGAFAQDTRHKAIASHHSHSRDASSILQSNGLGQHASLSPKSFSTFGSFITMNIRLARRPAIRQPNGPSLTDPQCFAAPAWVAQIWMDVSACPRQFSPW